MKNREQVENLKQQWLNDPCWDLWMSEGFAEYEEELKAFQIEKEEQWKIEISEIESVLDEHADKLGVRGLYRMILDHKTLLNRHHKAINALSEGHHYEAYKILVGIEE